MGWDSGNGTEVKSYAKLKSMLCSLFKLSSSFLTPRQPKLNALKPIRPTPYIVLLSLAHKVCRGMLRQRRDAFMSCDGRFSEAELHIRV